MQSCRAGPRASRRYSGLEHGRRHAITLVGETFVITYLSTVTEGALSWLALMEHPAGPLPAASVWDNVWPVQPDAGNHFAALRHHANAGVDIMSITVAGDNHNISQALQRTAAARNAILAHQDSFLLVETLDDVFEAKITGKLGIILRRVPQQPCPER